MRRRQQAERAFKHAHVLIRTSADVGALQRASIAVDQHRIVGTDQFVHDSDQTLSDLRSPAERFERGKTGMILRQ